MASIQINDVDQRVQYTATAGQTVFPVPFVFLADADIVVYHTVFSTGITTKLVLTTNYTLTGAGTASGGTMTLVVGAAVSDVITILGETPVDRTTIYSPVISALTGDDLNTDANREIIISKQLETTQDLLQLQYAPYAEVSQDVTVTTDRWLPRLTAGSTWRMNDAGTEIETVEEPAISVGLSGAFTADNRLAKSDLPAGDNILQETGITVSDTNDMSGIGDLVAQDITLSTSTISSSGSLTVSSATTMALNAVSGISISPTTTLTLQGITWPTTAPTVGQVIKATSPTVLDWGDFVEWNSLPVVSGKIVATLGTTGQVTDTDVTISGGIISDVTSLTVDNLLLDGNSITAQDVNGNVNLVPDGTGSVTVNSIVGLTESGGTITLTNTAFDANGTGNSLSNVDVADLSNGVDGSLISWDATGVPTTIAPGTSGHVLTSNGPGAEPTYQAAGGGNANFPSLPNVDARLVRTDGTTGDIEDTGMIVASDTELSGLTLLDVDNLRLDGNTLSSTDTNGNILLDPDGSGEISLSANNVNVRRDLVHEGDANTYMRFTSDNLRIQTGGTTNITCTIGSTIIRDLSVTAATITTINANEDLTLSPNGTGAVDITTGLQLASGVEINAILDEDNLVSDSDTAVPTQQSVKAYVDNLTTNNATFDSLPVVASRIVQTNNTTGVIDDSSIVVTSDSELSGITLLDVDNIRLDANTVSTTDVNGDLNLIPNGTGEVILNASPITNNAAATKQYVDLAIAAAGGSIEFKNSAVAATAANLNGTYDNGTAGVGATLTNAGALAALTIDGYAVSTSDRVLVKNQSSGAQNGIYDVTNVGSGAVAWVLTRSTDFDEASEMTAGSIVPIDNNGNTNALTSWLLEDDITTVGTDTLTFLQFTYGTTFPLLNVGNLLLNGNTISSTNTNGNVNIDPDGTGVIDLIGDTVSMGASLVHTGNTSTSIDFATDEINLVISSTDRVKINGSGFSLESGVAVNAILDEDNMVSDSATAIPTQQSTKAYVDAAVLNGATFASLPVVANRLMQTSNTTGQVDDSSIVVSTDDSLSGIAQLDVDNLQLDGNTISSTDTNGNVTVAPDGTGSVDLQSDTVLVGADIQHSGDSDTLINFATDEMNFNTGGTTRIKLDAGGFSLETGVSITAVLDEDNMASDSATAVPTQQSTKAYVDAAVLGGATFNSLPVVANRVVQTNNTTGEVDDSGLVITGDTALSGLTQLDVDNLRLDGNALSATDLDGDVNVIPNGTGVLQINSIDFADEGAGTIALSNTSFDANGTGNSLSNVDVADLANGTDGALITWDASGVATTIAPGTSGHVLTSNGPGAEPTYQAAGGGGSSESVTRDITQASHGFSVGDWIRLNGADTYTEAQADSAANAEVVGVVSAVADANNFTVQISGYVTGLTGLTANTVYFLDESTAGAITATEPTGTDEVIKPVLVSSTTTAGYILTYRGNVVSSGGGGGGKILQVVQGTLTSATTITSSALTDTGLTASITPASTANKILVMVTMSWSAAGTNQLGTVASLIRGSTEIFVGDAAGSRNQATAGLPPANPGGTTSSQDVFAVNYLDSPSTTSATTYKVQVADKLATTSTISINRSSLDSNTTGYTRSVSSIILMEVEG